jgi:hypothetical protein
LVGVVFFFFFFWHTGVWTQSFMCARLAFNHLSHTTIPLINGQMNTQFSEEVEIANKYMKTTNKCWQEYRVKNAHSNPVGGNVNE